MADFKIQNSNVRCQLKDLNSLQPSSIGNEERKREAPCVLAPWSQKPPCFKHSQVFHFATGTRNYCHAGKQPMKKRICQ